MTWREPRSRHDGPRPHTECESVLVLLNPSARMAVPDAVSDAEVARRLGDLGLECSIVHTLDENEARERAAQAAREGGWRAVVAAGGDGTVHAIAEGLWQGQRERARVAASAAGVAGELPTYEPSVEPSVALGILPLGTMNNIAHSLGISADLDAACATLARAEPWPLDAAVANDHFFLEVAGIGAEAALTAEGDAVKGAVLRHPGTVVDLARRLARYRPRGLVVEVDGHQVRTRALQVSVLNASHYGMSFDAAPEARMDDGVLDVVIFERVRWWELPAFYLTMMRGRTPQSRRVRLFQARSVVVCPEHAHWPVQLDGKVETATPVRVQVLPGALRVLAPPPTQRAAGHGEELTPVEVLLRATASPAASAAAHAALVAAARAGDVVAASTESALQALGTSSAEARQAVGVEPTHRGVRRARLVLAGYMVAFGAAIVTTLAVHQSNILPGDLSVTRAFQRTRSRRADLFWRAVAAPGFPRVSTPLVSSAAAAFWLLGLRLEAVFVVLASGTDFLNFVLKRAVKRERPTHDLVHVARVINEPGFPSGHVMHYLSFFGFLGAAAFANLKPSRLRGAVIAACATMVGLVGPSRVYLGAHWPSDVAAGYLYGGIYLGGLLQAYTWAKERQSLAQSSRRGTRRGSSSESTGISERAEAGSSVAPAPLPPVRGRLRLALWPREQLERLLRSR